MPNLPPSTDFTNSSVTEGGFKTAITNLREYLAGLLGTSGGSTDAIQALGVMFNQILTKSANYTIVGADRGKTIQCTTTLEIALTAAATLGGSFAVTVDNIGGGTVTINPNGAELIDGEATLTLDAGQSCIIYCNGTGFYTVGASSAGGFKSMQTITSSNASWTIPAKSIKVTVIGGGGNGSGGSGTIKSPSGFSSGAAGGAAIKYLTGLTVGSTLNITIGGVAGTTSVASGSQAISTISATGGQNGANNTTPKTGGSGAGGDFNMTGQNGGNVVLGGGSMFGGGGNAAGQAAKTYGGGGSGSGSSNGGTGGAGFQGVVIIEY